MHLARMTVGLCGQAGPLQEAVTFFALAQSPVLHVDLGDDAEALEAIERAVASTSMRASSTSARNSRGSSTGSDVAPPFKVVSKVSVVRDFDYVPYGRGRRLHPHSAKVPIAGADPQ